jgi:hypothetical protein
MSGELNFKAMPFEGYRTLPAEHSGSELVEEFGRGARRRSGQQGFVPRTQRVTSKQPITPPVSRPAKTNVPPFPTQRTSPYPRRLPWGAIDGPYAVAPEPYSAEPPPTPSEYIRWVQSALNDVLGLQLPVDGVADLATRSAVRSFQQRERLPIDGVVGPDTERALLARRATLSQPSGEPR